MAAEAKIEGYLIRQCKKHDIWTAKFTTMGTDGVPDRILVYNGMTVFAELKAPGKTVRPLQKAVIAKMKAHGAIVYSNVDSKEKVDGIIKDILSCRHKRSRHTAGN